MPHRPYGETCGERWARHEHEQRHPDTLGMTQHAHPTAGDPQIRTAKQRTGQHGVTTFVRWGRRRFRWWRQRWEFLSYPSSGDEAGLLAEFCCASAPAYIS